jgi:translation initiation factor 3 subunit B
MIGLQGFPFDKKHSLLINKFTDIERYANLQDTYVEPEIEPFAVQVCGALRRSFLIVDTFSLKEHLRSWLTDARGRDQAVTHHGETVAVEWFGKGGTAETVVSRKVGLFALVGFHSS